MGSTDAFNRASVDVTSVVDPSVRKGTSNVVKDTIDPLADPSALVALTRAKYRTPGVRPETDAETKASEVPATGDWLAEMFVQPVRSAAVPKQKSTVVDRFPGFTRPSRVAAVVETLLADWVVETGAPVVVKEATLP